MRKRFIVPVCITWLTICLLVAACAQQQKEQVRPVSGGKEEMRKILSGVWIIRDYRDFIRAGCTPARLRTMLSDVSSITYDQAGTGKVITTTGEFTPELTFDSLEFYPVSGRLSLCARPPYYHHGLAEIRITPQDTLLIYRKDTLSKEVAFVRWCRDSIYCHYYDELVGQKFVEGTYFMADDPRHLRPIVFDAIGNVTGAGNIDSQIAICPSYWIPLYLHSDTDLIAFTNEEGYGIAGAWYRRGDSLVIYPHAIRSLGRKVLLKAQVAVRPLHVRRSE